MREATITRKTAETDISLYLNLDGGGKSEIDSGIGFLDHMLTLFARHGRFDLRLSCAGDTQTGTTAPRISASAWDWPSRKRWGIKRASPATGIRPCPWTKPWC